ncbi:uncharacterized protein PG998_008258 [Apiospora kogelbergensis]|uniref:uncharacterized protein n=1 Tax=Apiospora kogelbergensis TaxID=1337665 RepID=UPI00312D4428
MASAKKGTEQQLNGTNSDLELQWADEESQQQEAAKKKMRAAKARRERRQRAREQRRNQVSDSGSDTPREQLRGGDKQGPTGFTPSSSSSWAPATASWNKQQGLTAKKRERRIRRINNAIIMYVGAVRGETQYGQSLGLGELNEDNVPDEEAKIKEITRTLNDRTYMVTQKARTQAQQQKDTETATKSSGSSVKFTLRNEGDKDRWQYRAFDEEEDSSMEDDDDDGYHNLFTTDDETKYEFDGYDYGLTGEDGNDDDEEVAQDIEDCLQRYLAGAVCRSDDDVQRLYEAKELMRSWIEKEERSRSAEIKNLRQREPEMSALEREKSREAIGIYDNFIYGGYLGGSPDEPQA